MPKYFTPRETEIQNLVLSRRRSRWAKAAQEAQGHKAKAPPTLEELHIAIVRGTRAKPSVKVSREEIEELLEKVVAARPDDPEGFANITGRNYVISQERKAVAAARAAVARETKHAADTREAALRKAARDELILILNKLAPKAKGSQIIQLEMVRLGYLEGLHDAAIALQYPNVSRDARYQWKRRGVQLVLPHASETLRAFMGYE